MKNKFKALFEGIKWQSCLLIVLGSLILAFGLYNVHAQSKVTEGGILGLSLLLHYWFNISPSITNFVFNVLFYLIGWKVLGRKFIIYSIFATCIFTGSYAIFELFPPLFPQIATMPLLASIVGALFVGIGVGLCVIVGGAPTGDDALAMSVSKLTKINIKWVYLISDLVVLLLSLTYIPYQEILYSLLTVFLSGQIIGLMLKLVKLSPNKKIKEEALEVDEHPIEGDIKETIIEEEIIDNRDENKSSKK